MKAVKKVTVIVLIGLLFVTMSQTLMAAEGKVNINTATKEELVTLKYVGDKIADKIIEYRKAQPFQTAKEITLVKGIGQRVYDANKSVIVVKNE